MSITSFFSLCSSLVRSRSSSRCALARARWCWRSRSAGVTVRPNSVSCTSPSSARATIKEEMTTCDDVHGGGEGRRRMPQSGPLYLLIMDGDLLDIGSQCSLSSCSQVEFLPIKCRCDLIFCKEHIIPDAHDCRLASTTRVVSDSTLPKFQRCAAPKCSKPSLDAFSAQGSAAQCARCSQSFCAE